MDRSLRGGTSSATGLEHAICLRAACESLITATVVPLCALCASAVATDLLSATPITQSSQSNTSMRHATRYPRKTVQLASLTLTAAALTFQSSVQDPSIHYVQVAGAPSGLVRTKPVPVCQNFGPVRSPSRNYSDWTRTILDWTNLD
jgi:hypothetical protein